MSELLEVINFLRPFHMIEVMTIDSSGKVKDLEPVTNPDLCMSIGKLFIVAEDKSISEGTVFFMHPEGLSKILTTAQ